MAAISAAAFPLLLGVGSQALAQTGDAPAEAEALFTQARSKMAQGDYAAACPLFAESQRLDPAAGALLNLADCEEHIGELVGALQHWTEAIAGLPQEDPAVPIARERAAKLYERVPRLVVQVPAGIPGGTRVQMDEQELEPGSLGAEIRVNPGSHMLVVIAPGRVERRQTITLGEGERKDITLDLGPPLASFAPRSATTPPGGHRAPQDRSFFEQHRWSLLTGGTAVALAGVGVALGVRTWTHYDELAQTCPGRCPESDLDALRTEAAATNVVFGVAGAAALASVGMFLFAERQERSAVAVALDRGSLRVVVRY